MYSHSRSARVLSNVFSSLFSRRSFLVRFVYLFSPQLFLPLRLVHVNVVSSIQAADELAPVFPFLEHGPESCQGILYLHITEITSRSGLHLLDALESSYSSRLRTTLRYHAWQWFIWARNLGQRTLIQISRYQCVASAHTKRADIARHSHGTATSRTG